MYTVLSRQYFNCYNKKYERLEEKNSAMCTVATVLMKFVV